MMAKSIGPLRISIIPQIDHNELKQIYELATLMGSRGIEAEA